MSSDNNKKQLSPTSSSLPSSSSQVILHDPSKQKIVLYDPSSQQITLCRSNQGRWYHQDNPINLTNLLANSSYPYNHSSSSSFATNYNGLFSSSLHSSTSASSTPSAATSGNEQFCPMCRQSLPSIYQTYINNNIYNINHTMHRDYFMILDRSHATDSRRSNDSMDSNDLYDQDIIDSKENDEIQPLSQDALNSGYYSKFFKKVKKLGSGSYGTVHLVKHVMHDISLGYFAIKIICVGDQLTRLIEILRYVHV